MLGADYVEHIHDGFVAEMWPGTGPAQGVRDRKLLESAVARPFQSAFGVDAYPSTVQKAVVLFHSLISNHPFHDGNKRTAVIALNHFLYSNGYWQFIPIESVYGLAVQTASYRKRGLTHAESIEEIAKTLHSWTLPFSELGRIRPDDPTFAYIYKLATSARLRIRRDKRNQLIPAE